MGEIFLALKALSDRELDELVIRLGAELDEARAVRAMAFAAHMLVCVLLLAAAAFLG